MRIKINPFKIEMELMLNGFCLISSEDQSAIIISLEEHREHLIKCRDRKYLDLQIENIESMIDIREKHINRSDGLRPDIIILDDCPEDIGKRTYLHSR